MSNFCIFVRFSVLISIFFTTNFVKVNKVPKIYFRIFVLGGFLTQIWCIRLSKVKGIPDKELTKNVHSSCWKTLTEVYTKTYEISLFLLFFLQCRVLMTTDLMCISMKISDRCFMSYLTIKPLGDQLH